MSVCEIRAQALSASGFRWTRGKCDEQWSEEPEVCREGGDLAAPGLSPGSWATQPTAGHRWGHFLSGRLCVLSAVPGAWSVGPHRILQVNCILIPK